MSASILQEDINPDSIPSPSDSSGSIPTNLQEEASHDIDLEPTSEVELGGWNIDQQARPQGESVAPPGLQQNSTRTSGANPEEHPAKSNSGQWEFKDSRAGWTFPHPRWDWVDEEDLIRKAKWEEIWAEVQNREGRNRFYPFSNQQEWEVAAWLIKSGLTKSKIDIFLNLDVSGHERTKTVARPIRSPPSEGVP